MIFRNLRNVNNTKCATYDIIFICFEDEGEKMRGKEINKPMLEICCGSFSDVKTAYENGADRVELNSALYMGGLTPTLANLIYAKENCNIPVVTMVRPRGGGFCYSDEEYDTMLMDAKILLEHGADGIAFGFLTEEKMLDKKRTKEMIELIHEYGREAVFHRAFDCIDNQDGAAEKLIRLGADRILTSGGAVNVWDGRKQLKHLQNQYGKDITILAGSGVNDTNARELIEYTGITQVHSSCGSWKCDVTAAGNAVDFSYDEAMKNCYQCADAGKVRKLAEDFINTYMKNKKKKR